MVSDGVVHRVLAEIEPWSGWLISARTRSYTDDPNTVGVGSGVYTAEDWTRTRSRGLATHGTDGTQFDSDQSYLRYVFAVETPNVIGALTLARAFDFGRYRSIFELGAGDMAQAFVLHRLHPSVRYVATDLDPYIVERCGRLPLLEGIEKRVLDVRAIDATAPPFSGFDLLTSWGMDYALDDAELVRLLRSAGDCGIPYLLCSATTIGLVKYLQDLVTLPRKKSLSEARRLRMHGWRRSIRRFKRLGAEAGMSMRVIGRFGYFFCVLFNPVSSRSGGAHG